MWMTDYVRAVKRGLRDNYGFMPTGGTDHDPVFADGVIPDGEYPTEIDGKLDRVKLIDGRFSLCNFDDPAAQPAADAPTPTQDPAR